MSHYEARLQHDLDVIRERLATVSAAVEQAIDRAVQGLVSGDLPASYDVVLDDKPINREIRAIDALCHSFVARHYPAAGHLRFISSVLRMDVIVERIGDYAVTIARQAVHLSAPPPKAILDDIELIAGQARRMLSAALRAWNEGDAEQARATMKLAAKVDNTFASTFEDLLQGKDKRPLADLFALLGICTRLERISDQAKNICEETVFTVTGETKAPKLYRVLFVDSGDDRLGRLAAAFGRKAFPGGGHFESLGTQPAAAVAADAAQFAEARGLDLDGAEPRWLATHLGELDSFHVIITLDAGAREALGVIPFHTVLQEWTLPEDLEAGWREATAGIRKLMETLRGEDAS